MERPAAALYTSPGWGDPLLWLQSWRSPFPGRAVVVSPALGGLSFHEVGVGEHDRPDWGAFDLPSAQVFDSQRGGHGRPAWTQPRNLLIARSDALASALQADLVGSFSHRLELIRADQTDHWLSGRDLRPGHCGR